MVPVKDAEMFLLPASLDLGSPKGVIVTSILVMSDLPVDTDRKFEQVDSECTGQKNSNA